MTCPGLSSSMNMALYVSTPGVYCGNHTLSRNKTPLCGCKPTFCYNHLFSGACVDDKQLSTGLSFFQTKSCSKGKKLFSKLGAKALQNCCLRGERSCKYHFLTIINYLVSL